jgi:IS30 family transposase
MKIRQRPALEELIKTMLEASWTPEQIAGRLREAHEGRTIVSAKGIYKWLYSPYGMMWRQYLASKRNKPRRRRGRRRRKILIPNRIFIDNRPREADWRIRTGDFEGDTLGVPKSSRETLAGVVDRRSLYFLAIKISRRGQAIDGYGKLLSRIPVHSLTLDNGVEHARYETLGVPTYFSHPYRAWEKPIIENTFQRLRRFLPKKARLDDYEEKQISAILKLMNDTPRKCLAYRTSEEVFQGTGINFNHKGCCI